MTLMPLPTYAFPPILLLQNLGVVSKRIQETFDDQTQAVYDEFSIQPVGSSASSGADGGKGRGHWRASLAGTASRLENGDGVGSPLVAGSSAASSRRGGASSPGSLTTLHLRPSLGKIYDDLRRYASFFIFGSQQ